MTQCYSRSSIYEPFYKKSFKNKTETRECINNSKINCVK